MMTKMNRRAMWFVLLLLVGQTFAADEVANISVTKLKVIGLQAVSEKHGVAFATVKTWDLDRGDSPKTSTVIVDLKTGKGELFAAEGQAGGSRISPCGEYAIGTLDETSWWSCKLSTKAITKHKNKNEIMSPEFRQWWGLNVVSAAVENEKTLDPLQIVSVESGKLLPFPRIHGMPLAGSSDGEQLAIVAFDKDVTKPVDIRTLRGSAGDTYLVRLDKHGKVLSTQANTKGPLGRPMSLFGRVLFSPKGRWLLIGTLSDAEKASILKVVSEGPESAMVSVVSMASVTDVKAGKHKTVPTAAMTGISGFDGDRVVQNVMMLPSTDFQWVVGEVGQKKLRKFAELGPMDRRRSCVEQTDKGMTIYFLEPGKNVIRKILVKEAKTEPWAAVKQYPLASVQRREPPRSMGTSGSGRRRIKFYGSGGEGNRAVFLVDSNCLMGKTFDALRNEMLRTIGRFYSDMEFSVIVMTDGKLKAFPAEGFQKAVFKGKMAASKFLEKIAAEGQPDPVEGMKEVLKRLGKSDIPSQTFVVLRSLTKARAKTILSMVSEAKLPKTSKMNMVYVGKASKEEMDGLKKIAAATGGRFIHVPIR